MTTLADRYQSTADLPTAIPVFPLQGCILLPRAMLPLNVFEPRYLKMVEDVLASDRVLGILQPAANAVRAESPAGKSLPLRNVGCVGRLTGFEELSDGRLAIILTGIARFDVESEIDTTLPYRRMHVSYGRFEGDLQPDAGEEEIDRRELLASLATYLDAKRLQADWESIEQTGSETLVNALALTCPYGPEEKQALLEAQTLKERAGVLLALSQMELAAGPGGDTRGRLQ